MKKKLFMKLLFALFVSLMFSVLFTANEVRANNAEEIKSSMSEAVDDEGLVEDESLYVEEKIMEYDAKTGVTREVNMEEIKQVNALLRNITEDGVCSIEPIIPDGTEISESHISTFSTRSSVSNTFNFPYRAICRLRYLKDGSTYVGTGSLVGKNLLLTCAHCVFDKDNNNQKYSNWIAYPGYQNGKYYNSLFSGWSRVYYSDNWMTGHSYEDDWALCVLENDIGSTTGCLGAQTYDNNSELKDLAVWTVGYPIDADPGNGEYQWETSGSITNSYDKWFKFTGYCSSGMSGGPVMKSSDRKIVGLTSQRYTFLDANRGWRLHREVLELIAKLRES